MKVIVLMLLSFTLAAEELNECGQTIEQDRKARELDIYCLDPNGADGVMQSVFQFNKLKTILLDIDPNTFYEHWTKVEK